MIPLMLDCLKSPGGGASASSTGDIDPDAAGDASSSGDVKDGKTADSGSQGQGSGGGDHGVVGPGGDGEGVVAKGAPGGEVVVLHYYQQHHQYLLKVAVLETMSR